MCPPPGLPAGSHSMMTYCLNKKSPISHKESRLLQLLGKVLPCITLPMVLKRSTTQVRVCGHAWALDPAPAASVTHRGRCLYPSWGNEIENKPAVKQNCCLVAQSCLTPWTVVCQASLSMRFCRQEYWSVFPCPPAGDLPTQRASQKGRKGHSFTVEPA